MLFRFSNTLFIRSITALVTVLLVSESLVLTITPIVANAEDISEEQETELITHTVVENEADETELVETAATAEESEESETVETESESEGANDVQGNPVIETGDAVADALIESIVNTNIVNTTASSTNTESEEDKFSFASSTASSSEAVEETSTATSSEEAYSFVTSETIASSTNVAVIDSTATVTADTGTNQASGDTATIHTGDAIAVANIVNLANTNIINSDGFIGFFNSLGLGTTNLSNIFSVFDAETSASTAPCALSICGQSGAVTIYNDNDATVNNTVSVTAQTGGNSTYGSSGSVITTGNAYAAANIFNVANTNVVDSNYLLLSFNNFGSYAGDIVLPNSSVINQLFNQTSGVAGPVVHNENQANINNNLSVNADAGGNEVTGGSIETGDSFAAGNVVNQVNQNLFGSDSFLLVLRVHGDWSGDVFGLPDGISWKETNNGIELYSAGSDTTGQNIQTTVTNTNIANINNDVSVYALTGKNKADGNNGDITTGNAYAGGNVVNVANTNVLGQNWALLVFDIFGDWNGNLSFGQPDLWVGAQATSKDRKLYEGSKVTYTFTVTNFGDVAAENVSMQSLFNDLELGFSARDVRFDDSHHAHFTESLGTIRPGQTKTVVAEATVGALPPDEEIPVPLRVRVSTSQLESDETNNEDTITVLAGNENRRNPKPRLTFQPSLYLDKSVSSDNVNAPDTVNYTVTIENKGGPAYKSLLIDTLYDPDGNIVYEERWELDTIPNGEFITIEYQFNYDADMPPGEYRNEAQVVALSGHKSLKNGQPYISEVAAASVMVTGPPGQVLGIATECPAYLNSFMQYDAENDIVEVLKLQQFLNTFESANVSENGDFDLVTHQAVKTFQDKYRDEVLLPWGMEQPSGYVYLTTRKKINEIYCRGSKTFPLAANEKAEINRFRFFKDQHMQQAQEFAGHSNQHLSDVPVALPRREEDDFEQRFGFAPKLAR